MPEFNGILSGFTDNSYLKTRYTVSNIPTGSIISSAKLTVKLTDTASDAAIVFSKSITASDVAGTGCVEDTGADTVGRLRFDIPPSDAAKIVPGTKYSYWVDVTLNTGEVTTIEKGTIFTIQGSTHA